MSAESINLTSELLAYLRKFGVREHPVLEALRRHTRQVQGFQMQISPEQGQLMALLIRLIGARKALELGTFTGYSALAVALALPADGLLVTCDVDAKTTAIARDYWEQAGVAAKITLKIGPGLETLAELEKTQSNSFDFAFIDADKSNYNQYYESALRLLRPGGLIAVDNVLWDGAVIDYQDQSAATNAIKSLNRKIAADERVDVSMIPIGDGLTLARKR